MTRKKEIMPVRLFEKVLRDYSDMGGGKLSLTPMVGDIFLDRYLMKRLELVRRYPKITGLSVTTNAVLADRYTDKELKQILQAFEKVHISIYGLDDEEYATMTRRPHYDRMLNSIKRFIQLSENKGKIAFGFRFLKNHTDEEIMEWMMKNFRSIIPFSATKMYSNWGNGIDTSMHLPFEGEWLPCQRNIEQCLIPLFACQIFSNGDVSFCHCPDFDINEELRLGNITEDSLVDIYNSEKCSRLWKFDENIPEFCRFCTFFKPVSDLAQYKRFLNDPISFIGG
jgi:radical SAM protein with 4Fe4S-binding SPASM domain